MLDFPVHIPRSKDGEEGYINSQRLLHYKRDAKCNNPIFRAPPNKTVHDRESPPPYYSNSASLESIRHAANRGMRDYDGCRVVRCHSMSSNVASPMAISHKDIQKQTALNTQPRTMSTNITTAGRTRTAVSHRQMDEPPDYEGIHSSDNNQVSLHVDNV